VCNVTSATLEHEEKRTATAQIFKDLAMEMLELAALDLSRPEPDALDRTPSAVARRADRHSATVWMSGEGGRATVPFALCCDAMNVPVDALRGVMLAEPRRVLEQIREITAGHAQELGRGKSVVNRQEVSGNDGAKSVSRNALSRVR
jgi:hypothetical protein